MGYRTAAALGISSLLLAASTPARADLPATSIHYTIDVRLDPDTRRLHGKQTVRWANRAERPLSSIPLHLYLNAFSHEATTWMTEARAWVDVDGLLELDPDPWGFIEIERVRQLVEGGAAHELRPAAIQPDDGNPFDRTLVEVPLAAALAPGAALTLEIEFSARLPIPIARTGGVRDFFLVAQWFPKIAVLETPGVRGATESRWAAHQFHAATEFYADFADWEVTVDVPSGWTVAATGRAYPGALDAEPGRSKVRFRQRAVHDFAFAAGRDLYDERRIHRPTGGGPEVEIRMLGPRGTEHQVDRVLRASKAALDVLSSRVGPYPYETLSVVHVPRTAQETAGMEYPTLVTGLPGDPLWDRAPFGSVGVFESVLVHEIGHQWFYGLLASNEQEEAFLDEGLNTYWEAEIMEALEPAGGSFLGRVLGVRDARAFGQLTGVEAREAIAKRPSWLHYPGTARAQNYTRPAFMIETAERLFGQKAIDATFSSYFRRYAFHHPDAEAFFESAREAAGEEMAAFLREGFERPRVPNYAVTALDSAPFLAPRGRIEGAGDAPPGVDPAAKELDSRVLVEITDPGWARGGISVTGTVSRRLVTPLRAGTRRDGDWIVSRVRVEGPGWDRLPVVVRFAFEDGVEVEDRWDGRAAWRGYRFLRRAGLAAVRLDPERTLAADVTPDDGGLLAEADTTLVADWAGTLAAITQCITAALALWWW